MTFNIQELDRRIEAMRQEWGTPALSLAVVKDDETIYARGFGERRAGLGEPVDEHTVFAVGSCTKPFTATAIAMLVQEGKLHWDDPVLKYLPDFQLYDPVATRELSVRDLLCHRCGLQTFSGDFMGYGSIYTPEELLRRVRYIPPAYRLRTNYGYANMMFLVAGMIIPVVSGLSWQQFIQQRLLDPLGMTRTTTGVQQLDGMDNVAMPHAFFKNQLTQAPYADLTSHAPAGAINSTASDMARWLRFNLANGMLGKTQLIDPAVLEEMRLMHTIVPLEPEARQLVPRRHFTVYGLGWRLSDYAGRLTLSHDGGVDGMLSTNGFLPEEGLGIVVLTNRLPSSLHSAVFFTLLDAMLGYDDCDWNQVFREFYNHANQKKEDARQKLSDERLKDTHPSLPLEAYAGSYQNAIYGFLTVELIGGALHLHPGAHPHISGKLEHWHLDTFYCPWSNPSYEDSFVAFQPGLDGRIASLRFKVAEFIDPLEYVFTKENER